MQADIGLNKNKTSRAINFGGLNLLASGNYDGWAGHVGAGISRHYDISAKTSITPGLRADYTRLHDQGYTETGAPGLNLSISGSNTDELILMVDARIAHAMMGKTTLTANLGVVTTCYPSAVPSPQPLPAVVLRSPPMGLTPRRSWCVAVSAW